MTNLQIEPVPGTDSAFRAALIKAHLPAADTQDSGMASLFRSFVVLPNRIAGEQHRVVGPSALIGASNVFERAVAAAILLFGFQSGAARATVVGVLIEFPVMPSVVWIVNRSKSWYEAAPAVSRNALTTRI
jgi:hypothetical protein